MAIQANLALIRGLPAHQLRLGDGVVLSTGQAVQTTPHSIAPETPSTDTGASGTAEFDAYGPGHITNFNASFDVAALG
jgi:hypothetical protein